MLEQGQEVAHQHGEAAVAAHGDDLPPTVRQLGADRLRQRVGHRPVHERAEDAPSAGGADQPRRPHGTHAGVDGEDGVVVGQLVNGGGDVLGMDGPASAHLLGICPHPPDQLAVATQHLLQEGAVGLGGSSPGPSP